MSFNHNRALGGGRSRFLPSYMPLSMDEARNYLSNPTLLDLSDEVLMNVWLRPASRHLQSMFGIDPRNYSSVEGSADETNQVGYAFATREQLDRDFQTALVIYVEKIAQNPEDVSGVDAAEGASRKFDHAVPDRARALLLPYRRAGSSQIRRG